MKFYCNVLKKATLYKGVNVISFNTNSQKALNPGAYKNILGALIDS